MPDILSVGLQDILHGWQSELRACQVDPAANKFCGIVTINENEIMFYKQRYASLLIMR